MDHGRDFYGRGYRISREGRKTRGYYAWPSVLVDDRADDRPHSRRSNDLQRYGLAQYSGATMTTTRDLGWARCRTCGTLTDRPGEKCLVCGASTEVRKPQSLQYVWAFWIAGVLAYIPGNLLPIMVTDSVAGTSPSTIIGGVISLAHHGSYVIAAVIFIASIAVPVSKFAIIAWLALSIQM